MRQCFLWYWTLHWVTNHHFLLLVCPPPLGYLDSHFPFHECTKYISQRLSIAEVIESLRALVIPNLRWVSELFQHWIQYPRSTRRGRDSFIILASILKANERSLITLIQINRACFFKNWWHRVTWSRIWDNVWSLKVGLGKCKISLGKV